MINLIDKWYNKAIYITLKVDNAKELKILENAIGVDDEMNWNNPYFTTLEKINLLCRWVTVHSIIYYERDTNIVSDKLFDNNCKQLKKMIVIR